MIALRAVRIGILGLGYVGLPLAVELAKSFPPLDLISSLHVLLN
jgi:UDP-N-acetyl-D-mannosaminuronate dehydrogenase